jgi:hypothetical protein
MLLAVFAVALGLEEEEEDGTSETAGQLAIYKEHFERGFLAKTREFYTAESDEFLEQNPVTEYVQFARVCVETCLPRVSGRSTSSRLMQTPWMMIVLKADDLVFAFYHCQDKILLALAGETAKVGVHLHSCLSHL